MPSCLVYYGTSEGQTKKIAAHLAERLEQRGMTVELAESPSEIDPSRFDAVIVGDSVHVGRYHRHVLKFVRAYKSVLEGVPSAFFSVCLGITSKNEEDRAQAHAHIDGMIERTGWKPDHAAVFAGALKYTEYGLLTRFIMKRISASEGLPTDTSRDYELTDWASVDAFADRLADDISRAPSIDAAKPAAHRASSSGQA